LTRRQAFDDDPSALTARAATRPVVAVAAAIVGLLAIRAADRARQSRQQVGRPADEALTPRVRVVDDRGGVRRRAAIGVCLTALLAVAGPGVAGAATTFNPTRFDDPPPDGCRPTDCSLREAVSDAGLPATSRPVTINLKPGRYEFAVQIPLSLPSGSVTTINGAGARLTTIDGNNLTRVLSANEGSNVTVNDLTITAGNAGAGQQPANDGGGIWVDVAATLALNRSVVAGNQVFFNGAGIWNNGDVVISDSTISGNLSTGARTPGQGGGIFTDFGGDTQLRNVTVSGNTAQAGTTPSLGGGIYNGGALSAMNVTIASNFASGGSGLELASQSTAPVTLWNTIVSADSGPACGGNVALITGDHNLDDDASCAFGAAGDKSGVSPLLGSLADNGGPTKTRALSAASPAINGGSAPQCRATDQRGVARPQGGACDIGAYEYRAPLLTVIKRVVNDDKGIEGADDFTVHVRVGAVDVAGSPAPGSASGRTYTLTPGSYAVGEDASEVYSGSFAGDCSASGVVVLGEGQSKTCTITNDDKAPGARVFNVEPKRGTVRIKLPGRKRFRRLTEGEQLPVGTTVDTLKGRVTIIAASNRRGGTARADFYDGIFKLGQTRGRRPITTLTLVEKLTGCKAAGGQASAAARKKRKRRLWGDGKGRFRTRGSHSAATVVGTKWLVEDRCASTLTRVVRGRVKVTDFEKDKTVFVRKGHRYIARAQ
jgi:hypothetical protein